VGGGREPGHVHADLGDQFLRAGPPDAGDLIQLGHLAGERGDRFLDPPGQRLDLGAQPIDAVEHHAQQVAVMVAEVPGQRLLQDADLLAHGAAGHPGQHVGVTLPPISASSMSRPDLPKMSLITADSLIWVSSSSFSTRCFSRVRSWIRVRR
jgi:hypothetical protein